MPAFKRNWDVAKQSASQVFKKDARAAMEALRGRILDEKCRSGRARQTSSGRWLARPAYSDTASNAEKRLIRSNRLRRTFANPAKAGSDALRPNTKKNLKRSPKRGKTSGLGV
jgi:hypothetical protein